MKTKHFSLTCLLFIILTTGIQAQNAYWLRGGWQYVRVSGHQSQIYNPETTHNFGFGYERIFSNPYGYKIELYYNDKGFNSYREQTFRNSVRSWINEVEQTSLAIPIFLTMHTNRFFIEAGLNFDFLLSSRQTERTIIQSESSSPVIVEEYNRVNFFNPELGAIGGVGIKLFRDMYLSARYIQGLTPISRAYNWTRMSYLQVSLSMRLGQSFTPVRLSEVSAMRTGQEVTNYRIFSHRNITRAQFSRTGDGYQVRFRWQALESGTLTVSNINLESNSGHVTTTGHQVIITDIIFPVNCRLQYTITNPLSGQSYENTLEFEIYEAGVWTVTLNNN